MAELTEGQKAPSFTLPTDAGGTVRLGDLKGRRIVLYFYPKDDTSGCTKQALAFTEKRAAIEALKAIVIGVSKDSVAAHDKFKAKHLLAITLGSDEDGKVVERYGVWVEKSMYGRSYMGIDRSTFLIDEAGVIRRIWRKVKVPGHVEAVIEALKAL
ncbi:MAG: thioredoxin-dependent thiol peroxidase [Alphaproteobacteria bacterium]|nr:thioredoxin-dependent thiol peroxidase [Alphaproteobacteria bacterium]